MVTAVTVTVRPTHLTPCLALCVPPSEFKGLSAISGVEVNKKQGTQGPGPDVPFKLIDLYSVTYILLMHKLYTFGA